VSKKLQLKVNPNSSQTKVTKMADGTIKLNLTAPPEDGKANKQLIEVLSDNLGIDQSRIKITRGKTSRNKTVVIS
jgi:uncharacterized protein (TIGR00251 family)